MIKPELKKFKDYFCNCCGRKLHTKAFNCPSYPLHYYFNNIEDDGVGERYLLDLLKKEKMENRLDK